MSKKCFKDIKIYNIMEVASKQKELGSGNGFPRAKKINCFQCKKIFEIKFVVPRQQYSLKNNWGF